MIYLRKLNMNDLNTTHAYSSDFENTYYMLNSEFSNIKETEKYLEKCINEYKKINPTFITFAVVYNEIHVGEVFATLSKDGTIIGWIINKNYWRKGIATTAANMLIDILKNEYNIKHLISYCDERNIASKKIMEKIGMNYIGENGLRNYCKNVSCAKELKFEMFL